jgi:hypothetical protein
MIHEKNPEAKNLDTVPLKGKDCELFFVLSNLYRIKDEDFGDFRFLFKLEHTESKFSMLNATWRIQGDPSLSRHSKW